jgi:hypothetical protein
MSEFFNTFQTANDEQKAEMLKPLSDQVKETTIKTHETKLLLASLVWFMKDTQHNYSSLTTLPQADDYCNKKKKKQKIKQIIINKKNVILYCIFFFFLIICCYYFFFLFF